jgi:hypothetical protein
MSITFSEGLEFREGIWYSNKPNELSYPEDGNDFLFQMEDSSYWFQHRNNCISAKVNVHAGDSVFYDIGGGNGSVSKAVQDSGVKTVLVEPGKRGCLNAKKRGVENVVCATFQEALSKEQPVSSIGLFDVLEHIKDDGGFLEEICNRMAVDGTLVITVPAYRFLWSVEDDQVGHYRRYRLSSLCQLLESEGFEILNKTYLFSILVLPIFLFRSIPSKFGSKRKYNDPELIGKEHGAKSTPRIMTAYLNWESKMIKKGFKMPFGSSCLVVARKKAIKAI